MISILCPNPSCHTTYPLEGIVDLGAMPGTGFPQGTTDAVLGLDCPACATHLDIRWTTSWRAPS